MTKASTDNLLKIYDFLASDNFNALFAVINLIISTIASVMLPLILAEKYSPWWLWLWLLSPAITLIIAVLISTITEYIVYTIRWSITRVIINEEAK